MTFLSELSAPLRKSPFYARPLALFCAVFMTAVLLIKLSYAWFLAFLAAVVIYSVVILTKSRLGIKTPLTALMLLAVVLGAVVSVPSEVSVMRAKSICGEGKTVKMTVTETLYEEPFGSAYYVSVSEIDGKSVKVGGTLEITEQYELAEFETVTVVGDVSFAYSETFGAELYNLKSKGLCLNVVSSNIVTVTHEEYGSIKHLVYKWRSVVGNRFDELLGARAAAYAKALITGERGGLTDEFRRDMSAIGVSHILAVSGMHTSIIAAIIGMLADKIRTARRPKSAIIALFAFAFMVTAGFSPSVVRAVIMLTISLSAVFFGRRSDAITSLFISGAIICGVSPNTSLSCSFLLSFFATLGLVLCASAASRGLAKRFYSSRAGDMRLPMKLLRAFLSSIAVSLCATLFTAPVLSIYFSEISYFAVIANLVAVPCAFVSVSVAVLVLVLGNVPLLGGALAAVFKAAYYVLSSFAAFCSDSLETSLSLEYPFFTVILILVASAMLFMRINGIRSPSALIAVLLSASLIFTTAVQVYFVTQSDENEVTYLSDKNSEALVVSSGSETMLIDIGKGGKAIPTLGAEIMMTEYYETRPDALMLTHYHSLHIGTVRHIVKNYRIKRIYVPVPESENDKKIYRSMEKYLSETEAVTYYRGEEIKFGNLTVATSEFTLLERSTHPVITVSVSDGKSSLLWLGASVTETEIAVASNRLVLESSVVISGAHGPKEKENIPYVAVAPSVTEIFLSPYSTADGVKLFGGVYFKTMTADENGIVKERFKFEKQLSQAFFDRVSRNLYRTPPRP